MFLRLSFKDVLSFFWCPQLGRPVAALTKKKRNSWKQYPSRGTCPTQSREEQKKGETNGKETKEPQSQPLAKKENTWLICSDHLCRRTWFVLSLFYSHQKKSNCFAVFAVSTQEAVETGIAMGLSPDRNALTSTVWESLKSSFLGCKAQGKSLWAHSSSSWFRSGSTLLHRVALSRTVRIVVCLWCFGPWSSLVQRGVHKGGVSSGESKMVCVIIAQQCRSCLCWW